MKTNFSFHAFERIDSRMTMTQNELAYLLDADLAINIGKEPKSNRVHQLFFSEKDAMCFVAIQDVKTGLVVTVLPIDYHENIAWAVSMGAQNFAKQKILNHVSPPKGIVPKVPNATVFKIAIKLVDEFGSYQKIINLCSWPCTPYSGCVDHLIEDVSFVDFMAEKINEQKKQLVSNRMNIGAIIIRLGCKGASRVIDI